MDAASANAAFLACFWAYKCLYLTLWILFFILELTTFFQNEGKRGYDRGAFRAPQGLNSPSYVHSPNRTIYCCQKVQRWTSCLCLLRAVHKRIQTKTPHDGHLLYAPSPYPVHHTAWINIQWLYQLNFYSCQQVLPLLPKRRAFHDMSVACSAFLKTSSWQLHVDAWS